VHAIYDSVAAIAVDRDGNAYLTGSTRASDFPVTTGAYETVFKPYTEPGFLPRSGSPFVTKLNQNGSALVYSTFLSGTQTLGANDIALDSAGNAYIASGGYISKLDPSGSALRFSEYFRAGWLPDYEPDFRTGWLALDSSENLYSSGGATVKPHGVRRPSSGIIVDFPILWVSLIKLSSSDSIPFFLPVVLSVPGLNGSYFTSELTLTNSGASSAPLEIEYRATVGGGSGTGAITLGPGTQQIFPDAMGFLSSLGIPVPTSGDRLGSLIIRAPKEVAVQARTTTRTGPGRAGLAYSTQPVAQALTEPVFLAGLRQNATDRSNVALLNVGSPADGDVVLRITVYPPDPGTSVAPGLFEKRLAPGEFKQISGILNANGLSFTEGFVRVERISGSAPYFAYAVINDQVTSDGSFIAPTRSDALNGRPGVILPVVVATPDFASELVLTNWSGTKKILRLEFVAETITATDSTATIEIELEPLTQRLIPDFVQFLRNHGVTGIEGNGVSYAGALFVLVDENDAAGLFVGSRTSSLRAGERYGVFFPAVPVGATTPQETWLHGLRQDSENRTNLALVNTGEIDTTTNEFEIEIFDGATGVKLTTLGGVSVGARRWRQINSLLADYAPGVRHAYLHIIKKFGSNPFIAYAVINDGAVPGDRTGDGAFISSSP
jgi:hypothetical protein